MLSWNEAQAAVPLIAYCTAALTLLSDNVNYITFLLWEWRITQPHTQAIRQRFYPGFTAVLFGEVKAKKDKVCSGNEIGIYGDKFLKTESDVLSQYHRFQKRTYFQDYLNHSKLYNLFRTTDF